MYDAIATSVPRGTYFGAKICGRGSYAARTSVLGTWCLCAIAVLSVVKRDFNSSNTSSKLTALSLLLAPLVESKDAYIHSRWGLRTHLSRVMPAENILTGKLKSRPRLLAMTIPMSMSLNPLLLAPLTQVKIICLPHPPQSMTLPQLPHLPPLTMTIPHYMVM